MINVAINGFGRIGRNFFKAYLDDNNRNFNIFLINDLADAKTISHLFNVNNDNHILYKDNELIYKDSRFNYSSNDIGELNLKNIDIVIESTGKFFSKKDAGLHRKNGADTVIITSPSDEADITLVPGMNTGQYDKDKHKLISASSCTAQALMPIVKALEELNIEKIMFSTIHPYTVNNALLDNPKRNLRESRSSTQSIVPAQTKADTGFSKIFPDIPCKAYSFKIPTTKVACLDTIIKIKNITDVEKVNTLLKKYSGNNIKLLAISTEPLVSIDLKNFCSSSIADLTLTQVINNLIRVFSWYDNEWAYSRRLYELAKLVADNKK